MATAMVADHGGGRPWVEAPTYADVDRGKDLAVGDFSFKDQSVSFIEGNHGDYFNPNYMHLSNQPGHSFSNQSEDGWKLVENRRRGRRPGFQTSHDKFTVPLAHVQSQSQLGQNLIQNQSTATLGRGGDTQFVAGVSKGRLGPGRHLSKQDGKSSSWSFVQGSKATSWKEICVHGRTMEENCKLSYVAPSISSDGKFIAKILRSEIKETLSRWSNTLVGYVLGDKPYYMHLKASVTRMWKPTCSLEIFSRDNGFFFFRFGTKDECDRILQSGPWLFDGRLIILKKWSEDLGLDRDLLSSVPVWIRFPSLHLKLWSQTIISKLSSLIGVPLFMDKATATGERLSYARCFVEINASQSLPSSVFLEVEEGDKVEVQVEFEWVPPICKKCCTFGHQDNHCPVTQVWQPKEKKLADPTHTEAVSRGLISGLVNGENCSNGKELPQIFVCSSVSDLNEVQDNVREGVTPHFSSSDSIELLASDLAKASPIKGPISGVSNAALLRTSQTGNPSDTTDTQTPGSKFAVGCADIAERKLDQNDSVHYTSIPDPNYVHIEECNTDSDKDNVSDVSRAVPVAMLSNSGSAKFTSGQVLPVGMDQLTPIAKPATDISDTTKTSDFPIDPVNRSAEGLEDIARSAAVKSEVPITPVKLQESEIARSAEGLAATARSANEAPSWAARFFEAPSTSMSYTDAALSSQAPDRAQSEASSSLKGDNQTSIHASDKSKSGNALAEKMSDIGRSSTIKPPSQRNFVLPKQTDMPKAPLFKGMFTKPNMHSPFKDGPKGGSHYAKNQRVKDVSDEASSEAYTTYGEDDHEDDEPSFPLTVINPEWQQMMENIESRKKAAKGRKKNQTQGTRKSVRLSKSLK